jgi:hypothetical protein
MVVDNAIFSDYRELAHARVALPFAGLPLKTPAHPLSQFQHYTDPPESTQI